MAVAEAPRASRAPKAGRDQESRSCQSSKTRRPNSALQAADAVREEQAAHQTDPRATESAPDGAVSECDPSPCPRGQAEPHGNSAPRTRRQRQRHEIDHGEIHTAAKSSLFLHDLQVPQISHQVSRGIAVRESALARTDTKKRTGLFSAVTKQLATLVIEKHGSRLGRRLHQPKNGGRVHILDRTPSKMLR